jgi:UDPglucose 6-dehydrogenase
VAEDAGAPDLEGVTIATDMIDAATGASVLALLTEWQDFRWADFAAVGDAMAAKSIVDARNLLEPEQIKNIGFIYVGVGRS